jgi:hypothetical protein
MVKALGIAVAVLLLLLGLSVGANTYQFRLLVDARAEVSAWKNQDAINRAEYEKAFQAAKANAKNAEERHAKEIASTVADLEAAKKQRDRERAASKRLRISADVCKTNRGQTETGPTAGRSDDPPGIDIPETLNRDLRQLAEDADRNTDQLRAAQAVIRSCYAAHEPSTP